LCGVVADGGDFADARRVALELGPLDREVIGTAFGRLRQDRSPGSVRAQRFAAGLMSELAGAGDASSVA
jgi:hypothetical protein